MVPCHKTAAALGELYNTTLLKILPTGGKTRIYKPRKIFNLKYHKILRPTTKLKLQYILRGCVMQRVGETHLMFQKIEKR
jgi:hypothetical protein